MTSWQTFLQWNLFFSVNHGVVLSGFQSRSDQAVAQLFLKLAAKSMP